MAVLPSSTREDLVLRRQHIRAHLMSSSIDLKNAACSIPEAKAEGLKNRLVYLCDWLPPDYGAVGQYSLMFARQLAEEGCEVTLVGLSSRGTSEVSETVGGGQLRQI